MIPWLLVWKWFKRLAPVLVVALLLVLIYNAGRSRGAANLTEVRAEAALVATQLDQAKIERDQARKDLDDANLKVIERAAAYTQLERDLREAADAERARLASSYARALEAAHAESAELRERVADLAPGEACLVVMKEMSDAMR